jgi:uncharacterized protein (DUF362 family)
VTPANLVQAYRGRYHREPRTACSLSNPPESLMAPRLTRRRFVQLAGLGLASLGPGFPLFSRRRAEAAPPAGEPLAEVRGADPATLVREALGKLGGMGRFVRAGQTVVVKPNIGWDRTPEEAANTHPAVVAEVCRLAVAAGAKRVRVFDRSCNDARRTYERSGIRAAVEGLRDERVRLEFVDEDRFELTSLRNAVRLTRWPLYRPALEADVFINVPIVKHHGLTGYTGALKNLMGVMGGNRGRIHQDIDENLADVNAHLRSHLVVMDATRVLLRNGPQGGGTDGVRVAGLLAATSDVVAADAWGARELGVNPSTIDHVRKAAERGLGIADLKRVRIL